MTVLLSRKDLRHLLDMADVIDAVEKGFQEYKKGRSTVPVRIPVKVEQPEGIFLFMPAYLERESCFGTKIVSAFPGNLKRGLPTIRAVYLLSDPTTGELLALMDGTLLTAMRTGATSAVATKYLARKDSAVLGIIGTGVQAPFQVEAICIVRPIQTVLAYDKDQEILRRFVRSVSETLGIPVKAAMTSREVVVDSDIVVTVTTSTEPVFYGRDLKLGVHINAVGAYRPEMRELDDVTVKKARIVVDTYEGCMAEAGDLLIPMKDGKLSREDIHADLGDVVLGRKPGRVREEETTLFKSVGFALEDLMTARLAYKRAKEQKRGFEFSMDD